MIDITFYRNEGSPLTKGDGINFILDYNRGIFAAKDIDNMADLCIVDCQSVRVLVVLLTKRFSYWQVSILLSLLTTSHLLPSNSNLEGFFPARAWGFEGLTGFFPAMDD